MSFDDARVEWKSMSSKLSWYTLIGDLYVTKYPPKASSEASAVKKSLFEADDSLHAWIVHNFRNGPIPAKELSLLGPPDLPAIWVALNFSLSVFGFLDTDPMRYKQRGGLG